MRFNLLALRIALVLVTVYAAPQAGSSGPQICVTCRNFTVNSANFIALAMSLVVE
ncbi:hypothetical protein M422DRAFT_258603 [Sphaerobolus stellatus SS14]|uniref:Unplaced genomic scaffold SPHSTscaffold_83, whole genome shotgun sequence n=1 Tax=Sphaerobolus stellatus (strain SS14) TaxID=990650 RepID=A0A0C9VB01_SPHS4|nr:hypothetical protein M422DRAFT_258603 [Sphaerobolus stellatus SS14]